LSILQVIQPEWKNQRLMLPIGFNAPFSFELVIELRRAICSSRSYGVIALRDGMRFR
jgi:hypothetical protein